MRTLVSAVLDLLLPSLCPGCQIAGGPGLCPTCIHALPRLEHPCPWCGAARRDLDARCGACDGAGLAHLQQVRVDHPYHGGIAHLVGLAKTVGRPAAVRALGDLLPDPPDDAPNGGVVVPVPASPGRRPGPHLGSALARAGARRWHLPLRHLLTTTRLGAEQHRLSPAERRANVVGLFRCVKPAPAYVVLVDDLITTGATASAAAAALRQAGAKRVDLVCLARTPGPGEYATTTKKNIPDHTGGSGAAALSGGRQTP
ncbi:MAG: ComF family protein [Planctomycetes bacterium]|nr:ComF family protein [Planctomycetota bacterium]